MYVWRGWGYPSFSYILPCPKQSPGKVILDQILRSQFRDSQMQHMQAVEEALNGKGMDIGAIEELPSLKPNIFGP